MRGRQEQQRKNEELMREIKREHKIDINRVKILLANKADPAFSILHAATTDRVDVLNELLQAKADIHLKSMAPDYSTPLHNAAKYGSEEMVIRLLEAKAQVNFERNSKRKKRNVVDKVMEALDIRYEEYGDKATPLHLAAEKGRSEVVKILLKYQADINIKNVKGENVFQSALRGDDAETIRALLEAKACSHSICSREFALMDAVFAKSSKAVQVLLASKVNPNFPHCKLPQDSQTLLSTAIENEDYPSALSLVKARANIPRKDALKEEVLEIIEDNPTYEALYNAARATGTIAAVLAAFHPRLGKTSPIKTAYDRSLGEPQTMLLPLHLAGVPVNRYAKIGLFTTGAGVTPALGLQTGSDTSIAPVTLPPPHRPLTHEVLSSSGEKVAAPGPDSSEEEPLIMLP